MENQVRISGWLGEHPKDYPETEEKARFLVFDIALNPKRLGKNAQWIRVNAHGEVADRIADGYWIRKGDYVRVEGFLAARTARAACGRYHRFLVVVAKDLELLEGSNQREEKHWADVPRPPLLSGKDNPDLLPEKDKPAFGASNSLPCDKARE